MTFAAILIAGSAMFTQLNPHARQALVHVPGDARPGETRAQVVAREWKESADWPKVSAADGARITRENAARKAEADIRRAALQKAARERTGIRERIIPAGDFLKIYCQTYRVQRRLVTQRQWEKVMGTNPSTLRGPDLPVTGITKAECREFARRAGELDGETYQLMNQRQWEFSCRALASEADWRQFMATGEFPEPRGDQPNAFGLLDTNGEIIEWREDSPALRPFARRELATCGVRLMVDID